MIHFFKRFKTAFFITLFINLFGALLIGGLLYLSEGFTFKSEYPILILLGGFFLFFSFSFFLIQYQNEYYIFSKVKALYGAFYSDGIPLSKELLKRDAQSLTKSIQEFAEESKLESNCSKEKRTIEKNLLETSLMN